MGQGRFVHCRSGIDGEEVDQWVDRSVCTFELRPGCPTCPNSRFEAVFQIQTGAQTVACPRWDNKSDVEARKDPVGYVFTPRAVCLETKPFDFCLECPNAKPDEPPRDALQWFEEEERQRKIELELDEELDE